ncbi:MAG: hypothetical protein K0R29_2727 [Pseudobdellovibrio sp.]|jgi:hypothetical protein|nr:hypothetical protein [Pseudobdellovibrio sp.]
MSPPQSDTSYCFTMCKEQVQGHANEKFSIPFATISFDAHRHIAEVSGIFMTPPSSKTRILPDETRNCDGSRRNQNFSRRG